MDPWTSCDTTAIMNIIETNNNSECADETSTDAVDNDSQSSISETLINNIIDNAEYVMRYLKSGFTEHVYQKALVLKLRELYDYIVTEQVVIPIMFERQQIGYGIADVIVQHKAVSVIVELKARSASITENDKSQLQAYMRTTGIERGVVLCFSNTNKLHIANVELKH